MQPEPDDDSRDGSSENDRGDDVQNEVATVGPPARLPRHRRRGRAGVSGGQVVPAMIAHGHLLWWLQQGERACVPDSEGWGASRPGIDRTPVLGCCAVQVHVSRMSFAPLTGTATALRRVRVGPM